MSYLHGYSAKFAAVRKPGRLAYTLAVLAALVCIASLAGCVNVGELREDALAFEQLNRIHAANPSLPRQAREIAEDNAEAWAAQAWELGGPKPASVAEIAS